MRSWYLVLAISVLVLAGCEPQEEVVTVMPRVVPTATPRPTGTATAVATQIMVQVETSTAVASQMPLVKATDIPSNPTPLPTPLSIPYPSPQFVPPGPYQLQTPRLTELFEVLAFEPDITRLVENDLAYYYANDISSAFEPLFYLPFQTRFLKVQNSSFNFFNPYWWLPGSIVQRILREDVIHFFSQEAEPFTPQTEKEVDNWNYTPYPVDVDGDGQTEWLLRVEIPGYNMHYFDLLKENSQGGYDQVPNEFIVRPLAMFSAYDMKIDLNHDLTSDNLSDIVIGSGADLTAGGFIQNVEAFSWNGFTLKQLDLNAYYESDLHLGTIPEFLIADFTGDGVDDIRLHQSFNRNFDCSWEQVDIFSWMGLQSQHQLSNYSVDIPPDEVMCNIWRATLPPGRIGRVSAEEKLCF